MPDDVPNSEGETPPGRDDRVSLWPLSFEAVVRALHKTPRPNKRAEPPPAEDS